MVDEAKRQLKVFLCHASGDKPKVRELYRYLRRQGMNPWLDAEDLLPGQKWQIEIPKALETSDAIVICLSKNSVDKEGYVQKEIKFALDIAEEKPEGTIFLIPARLEDCPAPERLSHLQWVDLYDENGFVQLLRSLKLRAIVVGAVVEPPSDDVDPDQEGKRKLDQLYTDGLAAFYTEDWDRAYHLFQSVLSKRPNDNIVAEKLKGAERQKNLAKLYAQALEAQKSENWQKAITALEKLKNEEPEYKDATALLEIAKKKKQLNDLYEEARTLHHAEKWEAVVAVFTKISKIDPNYKDIDRLKETANQKAFESARYAELKEYYNNAIREMDAGNWQKAYRLLKQVRKLHSGFLETERLLVKVESEIKKISKGSGAYQRSSTFWKWVVASIIGLLILGGVLFLPSGVPVKFTPEHHGYLMVYSESEGAGDPGRLYLIDPQKGFFICRYDIGSGKYQIAETFWGCKSNKTIGWVKSNNFQKNYWVRFIFKQP